MSKDYIHRIKGSGNRYRTSNVSRKGRLRIKLWFGCILATVLLSAFVFGLYELRHHHTQMIHLEPLTKKPTLASAPVTEPPNPRNSITTSPQDTQPIRFDFYQMLPKQSVGLTDISMPISAKVNPNQQYLLQIATLSNEEDALDMKNDLQKRGFQPNVMTVHRDQRILYRIQIGPFNDKASANKVYQQLKWQNIDSIFLTIQGN